MSPSMCMKWTLMHSVSHLSVVGTRLRQLQQEVVKQRQATEMVSTVVGLCIPQAPHLDSWLNEWQRADLLAFTALVEAYLEPATVYTTWVEQHSYASHTAVRPAPDEHGRRDAAS